MNLKSILAFVCILLLVSCGDKFQTNLTETNKETESAFNNLYQPSEMALLMEDMYNFYKENKDLVIDKKPLGDVPDYFDEIYTAEFTDGFEHNELFRIYSDVFIKNVKLLHNSNTEDKTQLYNDVVNSCVACHKSDIGCTGPIPRIQKLLIQN